MTAVKNLSKSGVFINHSLKNRDGRICQMGKRIFTSPLETATRKKIDQMLDNLGWHTDEFSRLQRDNREGKDGGAERQVKTNQWFQKATRLRIV